MAYQDYPRMMFHRTKPPVTIHSREEENELGREWSRTVWPAALGGGSPAAVPAPEPPAASAVPESDAAPGGGDPPGAPHPEQQSDLKKYVRDKLGTGEPSAPVKRYRAPTVKPTGKVKRKYGRD